MKATKIVIPTIVLISLCISYYVFTTMTARINSDNELISTIYTERIQSFFEKVIEPTQTIESLIRFNSGNISQREFEDLAATFFNNSYMKGLSYLPNGISTYSYPVETNKNIIGKDVFKDNLAKNDAIKARDTNQIVVSGPMTLPSGAIGIVVRNPVYIEDEFWGFVASAVDPVKMLETQIKIEQLYRIGYELSIKSNYDGNTTLLYESAKFKKSQAANYNFVIGGNDWTLSLYNVTSKNDRFFSALASFFVSLLSFLLVYFGILYHYRKNIQITNEVYHDELTNLYNRKFTLEYNSYNNTYLFFYIDLNDFKPVNDTYSHEMGDNVLKEFARRLSINFRENTYISRLGGDEFAIIIEGSHDERVIRAIKNRILTCGKETFIFDDVRINISASVGFARYPLDGEYIQEIMTVADKNMYEDKRLSKRR